MEMGYGRVSAKDQNPERQLLKFRELGIDERYVFLDKLSGKDFNRPRYQAMRLMIREGDLIYIDALDRLGRDYEGIIAEWKYITREVKADIICLDNETLFDSRKFKRMGDFGKVMEDQFLSLLAYVAEQERKKNRQRQAEGIEVAKAEGVRFGRPKREIDEMFIKIYNEWNLGEITGVKAIEKLGMKRRTFYRRVNEYEELLKRQTIGGIKND
ncbi:recombinase family protein [Paenibacillus physcomitrellae]|uniref:DNA recombinase n=1 Tax=Paenibacillus physcomitrellae TaxID=1619311 RepID=A0ABQ1GS19_9BACL|nr:recombinase family protein [Paenibacillus physcomitrellae]GGA49250.1 DNA recombinase [Paenibacillus physcomitrellae]